MLTCAAGRGIVGIIGMVTLLASPVTATVRAALRDSSCAASSGRTEGPDPLEGQDEWKLKKVVKYSEANNHASL